MEPKWDNVELGRAVEAFTAPKKLKRCRICEKVQEKDICGPDCIRAEKVILASLVIEKPQA